MSGAIVFSLVIGLSVVVTGALAWWGTKKFYPPEQETDD